MADESAAFCETAWSRIAGLRQAIYDLPLNREMPAGTLDRDKFITYLVQDSLYLVGFSRALALAAARAPDVAAMETFAGSAQGALVAERSLHATYFATFGIDADAAARTEPNPVCQAYTDFLLAAAHGPWPVLVAAVLPCFWIYWDVGNRVAQASVADNPYQAWIDTYSDPEFGQATEAVKAIADRAAAAAAPQDRPAMLRAFQQSSRYEWMFWDAAYRQQDWPVSIG